MSWRRNRLPDDHYARWQWDGWQAPYQTSHDQSYHHSHYRSSSSLGQRQAAAYPHLQRPYSTGRGRDFFHRFDHSRRPQHRPHYPHRDHHTGTSRMGDHDYSTSVGSGRTSRSPYSPSSHRSGESSSRRYDPPDPPRTRRPLDISYRQHDNRPVTPPPQQVPSVPYMAIASQDPYPLEENDYTASRKLLVLDLNGTLLHRAAYRSRARGDHASHSKTVERETHDDQGNDHTGTAIEFPDRTLPHLRAVHPRPYMGAFRSYLFAPETKEWLDVMIWSSAQPRSVNDMVDKTFGDHQDELVAIWARDTLGLSNEHYARKVQTFKDLTKPWAELPALLDVSRTFPSSAQLTPHSSPQLPPSSLPLPLCSSPSPSPIPPARKFNAHSALTTLLLDDSPRKAELQPYNHVCIPEYDNERRFKDVQSLLLEQGARKSLEYRAKLEAQAKAESSSDQRNSLSAHSELEQERGEDSTPEDSTRKRKRKEKKLAKKAASMAGVSAEGEELYDTTLLAVVGILDEARKQGNVAAWIHSGGLWGDSSPAFDKAKSAPTPTISADLEKSTPPLEQCLGRGHKRAKTFGKEFELRQDDNAVDPASGTTDFPTGNDSDSRADDGGRNTPVPPTPLELWFQNKRTSLYWERRGRKVLENMAIPVAHGLER